MAELSRRSGVPVATIKFYVREGLLSHGRLTAPNQAEYDDTHLDRLALIRALREAGGLSVSTLRRVFAAMDEHRAGDRPGYLSIAVRELTEPADHPAARSTDDHDRAAHEQVDALLAELGWDVDPDSPGRADLERAVANVLRYLPGTLTHPDQLVPFAEAVRRVADVEIPDGFDADRDPAAALRFSVLGTVLFEPVLLALRKLAHVDRLRTVARP